MSDLQPRLVLSHSKVLKPRTTKRPKFRIDTRSGKSIQIGTENEVNHFDDLRWSYGGSGTKGRKLDNPIPRPIQLYRWWFRYLQLALELEVLDYTFIERVKVDLVSIFPLKTLGGLTLG